MPIVVKLSHAFYDRFGDEVVDELVGVLNQVDAASQQSLRDLNEANAARVDARIDRLGVELRADIATLDAKVTTAIHGLDTNVSAAIHDLDTKFTSTLSAEIAGLDARLSAQLVSHMRWMVGMWGAMLLAMMALWFKP